MKKLLAALLVATSAIPASATVFHYTLQNVTFSDGGTATGVFDFDTVAVRATNIDILTSGGIASNHYVQAIDVGAATFGFDTGDQGGILLQLIGANNADFMSGGTVAIGSGSGYNSFEWYDAAQDQRNVVSGSVTTAADVPEPAMLGLFGLGAIGLGLSRRRKA